MAADLDRFDSTTRAVLRVVEGLGFRVSVFENPGSLLGTVPAFVEMHAVDDSTEPAAKHLARVYVHEHQRPDYSFACQLAQ